MRLPIIETFIAVIVTLIFLLVTGVITYNGA